jgi:hypothetical protein
MNVARERFSIHFACGVLTKLSRSGGLFGPVEPLPTIALDCKRGDEKASITPSECLQWMPS